MDPRVYGPGQLRISITPATLQLSGEERESLLHKTQEELIAARLTQKNLTKVTD